MVNNKELNFVIETEMTHTCGVSIFQHLPSKK